MFLAKISITNFRSITRTHAIEFSDYSAVIWKNNEWKSNILKAINIAMNVLQNENWPYFSNHRRISDDNYYSWERDYPINLQGKSRGKKETRIKLEFHLTSTEIDEIAKWLKSVLNWVLPIEIIFTPDSNKPNIKIVKKGKWASVLEKKKKKIFDYISSQISFTYIPAIRTEEHAMGVINSMISKELSKIESDPEFQKAINIIKDKQEPVFERISETIFNSITTLLPSIKSVNTVLPEQEVRLSFRRNSELWIDDWTKTRVESKWDWVKSLVALSLLKDIKKDYNFSFVAIEEPESHLHPWAIRALYKSIVGLSKDNQILVSTHNPLFVDIKNIVSNIIVSEWEARPAGNIKEIRELLWVNVEDNLLSTRYVLVVEWEDDAISLNAILKNKNEKIKEAIDNNILKISSIWWWWKLAYKLSLLKNEMSLYHVFLDNDQAGKDSFVKASEAGLLEYSNTTYSIVTKLQESEFEDMIKIDYYKEYIKTKYAVDIDNKTFTWGKNKWSKRLENYFETNWKRYDKDIERDIKYHIANEIKKMPNDVLKLESISIINSLIQAIENLMIWKQ